MPRQPMDQQELKQYTAMLKHFQEHPITVHRSGNSAAPAEPAVLRRGDETEKVQSVFVSSTFRDMQAERDILRDRVLPAIEDFASAYSRSVELVDLRWGVDTSDTSEEEQNRKVLNTCLDEIDRCRPFFIGLLGDRYGWVPDENAVRSSLSQERLDLDLLEKSVTAMEIEYGVLQAEIPPVCLFCFRENIDYSPVPEHVRRIFQDPQYTGKLNALKQRIRDHFGPDVLVYTASFQNGELVPEESFADMLKDSIIRSLEERWGEPPHLSESWQQIEMDRLMQLRIRSRRAFTGREAFCEELDAFLQSDRKILLLKGGSGTGKSSLMTRMMDRAEQQDAVLLSVSCGLSDRTSHVDGMIRLLITQLCAAAGLPDPGEGLSGFTELKAAFFRILNDVCKDRKVILIADALDQLVPCAESSRLLWLSGDLPDGFHALLSYISGPEEDAVKRLGGEVKEIPSLSDEDARRIIVKLAEVSHKQLSEAVIREILNKKEKGTPMSPLYIRFLLSDISMLDRYEFEEIDRLSAGGMSQPEALAAYLHRYLQEIPSSAEGAYQAIVRRLENRIGAGFVRTVLSLLAASRYGLREDDLADAFDRKGMTYNPADFAWLRASLDFQFTLGDAMQWDYSHSSMRRSITSKYPESVQEAHHLLAEVFKAKRHTDRFADREVMYHMIMDGQSAEAADLVLQTEDTGSLGCFAQEIAAWIDSAQSSEPFMDGYLKQAESYTVEQLEKTAFFIRTGVIPSIDHNTDVQISIDLINNIISQYSRFNINSEHLLNMEYKDEFVAERLQNFGKKYEETHEETAGSILKEMVMGAGVVLGGLITSPFARYTKYGISDHISHVREYGRCLQTLGNLQYSSGRKDTAGKTANDQSVCALWTDLRTFDKDRKKLLAESELNDWKFDHSHQNLKESNILKYSRSVNDNDAKALHAGLIEAIMDRYVVYDGKRFSYQEAVSLREQILNSTSDPQDAASLVTLLEKTALRLSENEQDPLAEEYIDMCLKLRRDLQFEIQTVDAEWSLLVCTARMCGIRLQNGSGEDLLPIISDTLDRMQEILEENRITLDRMIDYLKTCLTAAKICHHEGLPGHAQKYLLKGADMHHRHPMGDYGINSAADTIVQYPVETAGLLFRILNELLSGASGIGEPEEIIRMVDDEYAAVLNKARFKLNASTSLILKHIDHVISKGRSDITEDYYTGFRFHLNNNLNTVDNYQFYFKEKQNMSDLVRGVLDYCVCLKTAGEYTKAIRRYIDFIPSLDLIRNACNMKNGIYRTMEDFRRAGFDQSDRGQYRKACEEFEKMLAVFIIALNNEVLVLPDHDQNKPFEQDGMSYDGAWAHSTMTGEGTLTDSVSGTVSTGSFLLGALHGSARQTQADGTYGEGNWFADKADGEFRFGYPDGHAAVSTFVKGEEYGRSEENGTIHTVMNGEFCGYYRKEDPDGSSEEGYLYKEMKQGHWTERDRNGTVRKTYYLDNISYPDDPFRN